MSEQKRCPECSCETDKAQCGCAVEDKYEKLKQSFEPLNLLTESELMAELEKDAEVIRTHFFDCDICESKESGNKALQLFVDSERYFIGNEFEYRPDPVAPAKWEPVFVFWPPSQDSEFEVYRAFSLGMFHENGNLIVQYGDHEKWSADWCSVNDRNHHSPGWRKEWEPCE